MGLTAGDTKPEKRCLGTSIATPIAAGIAALIVQFARQNKHLKYMKGYREDRPGPTEYLETPNGMKLASDFVSSPLDDKFKYLTPWSKFDYLAATIRPDREKYKEASVRVPGDLCRMIEEWR